MPFGPEVQTRRQLLKTSAAGFGHVALSALLGKESLANQTSPPVDCDTAGSAAGRSHSASEACRLSVHERRTVSR